jgi:hypothetical protein
MQPFQGPVGVETELAQVAWQLRDFAGALQTPVVGAYQVTCSDEAEWECARAFQRSFVEQLLPGLKPDARAAFRTINLGARYEPGAISLAEAHFATPESRTAFKLLVVKINAHVGVRTAPEGIRYGWTMRYQRWSPCCGALGALLEGGDLPGLAELRVAFGSGGKDRLATLRDESLVPAHHRALLAAVVSARLQADRAVADVEKHRPETPTVYLVLACVTLNRPGPDTELIAGQYAVDWSGVQPVVKYQGLGDDPAVYRVRHELNRLHVEDAHWPGHERRFE